MAILIEHDPREGAVPSDGTRSKLRSFFGLKWKIMLLSGLILLIVVTSFSVISYRILIDNFENQSEAQYQRYVKEIEGLIEQTSQNLHQIAGLVPFLKGMDNALLEDDGKSITRAFDLHWASLQLNNGVHLVRFYDKSNRLLASWGTPEPGTNKENDAILKWVR